jgi:hypothetical protein
MPESVLRAARQGRSAVSFAYDCSFRQAAQLFIWGMLASAGPSLKA